MALKWGFNDAGLGDIPGLDYDKMVHAIVIKLAENDITQFFGKIQNAIDKWQRENARIFPSEYAVIRIHPYAYRGYLKMWPQTMVSPLPFGSKPNSVFGVPIDEDQRMFRTSWELQLGGKLLESGEVLEIVE
jgi:hypothetical protein